MFRANAKENRCQACDIAICLTAALPLYLRESSAFPMIASKNLRLCRRLSKCFGSQVVFLDRTQAFRPCNPTLTLASVAQTQSLDIHDTIQTDQWRSRSRLFDNFPHVENLGERGQPWSHSVSRAN